MSQTVPLVERLGSFRASPGTAGRPSPDKGSRVATKQTLAFLRCSSTPNRTHAFHDDLPERHFSLGNITIIFRVWIRSDTPHLRQQARRAEVRANGSGRRSTRDTVRKLDEAVAQTRMFFASREDIPGDHGETSCVACTVEAAH